MIDLREDRLKHIRQSTPRRQHFAERGASVRVTPHFRADVHFWLNHLSQWNGSQRWRSADSDPFVFATDASLTGFGFYLEATPRSASVAHWPAHLELGAGYRGAYSPEDARLHRSSGQMTWCELFAVYAALFTYRSVLRDCSVLFLVDNETDVHVLNRQATRARRLSGLLRAIFAIAVDRNLCLAARHRPGTENVLADFLSRPELHASEDTLAAWRHFSTDLPSAPLLRAVYPVYSRDFSNKRLRPS
jgi:hypothetical protein